LVGRPSRKIQPVGRQVTVKPPPGASPAQIQEMWRILFKRRLKTTLQTGVIDHIEPPTEN